jgi:hypothetical protein
MSPFVYKKKKIVQMSPSYSVDGIRNQKQVKLKKGNWNFILKKKNEIETLVYLLQTFKHCACGNEWEKKIVWNPSVVLWLVYVWLGNSNK